ncbi:right-handed parallel beta-helix repeat-containing protein [Nannocystis sp. SCPEA4]|uniref:right-handed parallel beta-helix repeat-containing protein n=1 Tax=Nannocystis sp. SCPEA4 TaxID=2996787 RepID=UPI002270ED9C|nr:right-handed parallel beta-helix repeat-containing protein [Nannocystis sp. SCPEA4]MCY1061726.1 right-handed parallel beta-helix repeat-containing protein [Nannocystis sp. SCPEA4]
MANHDLSRHLFRPANRYTGLRMQQGRDLLDSDINEGEMLDDEDRRAVLVDVIGPHGSADDGFRITNPRTNSYDFDILAGSYYLGGVRHQIEDSTDPPAPQRYRSQSDWRQFDPTGPSPAPPQMASVPRHDLVYLVGWEQTVSSVEDPEFREFALGGPDTTERVRPMHRVYVRPGGPAACADAFDALVADLVGTDHSFDRGRHELLSGARLTVRIEERENGDLCKPALADGYTGAENQAIRVQLIEPDRLLWAYDNAAPLYRGTIATSPNGVTITFLTTPRDQAHFPVAGQIVEILPWGATLANGSHLADHQVAEDIGGGLLARVTGPYDPTTGSVPVSVESAADLARMQGWFGVNEPHEDVHYFYLRVWNPGDGRVSGPIGLQFKVNELISLAGTGLEITIDRHGIVGDYWILAARPSSPLEVIPRDLLTGAAPHGPRRFYCPLALIHWHFNATAGAASTTAIDSCRQTFKPLTRQGRCCTVTVGDDSTSYGDYTSINAALAAIPEGTPGKICILPGVYEERVVVSSRSDIVFEGCGVRTIIRSPATNGTSQGLFTILKSQRITVKDLKIDAIGQFGVMIYGSGDEVVEWSSDITLRNLDIATDGDTDAGAISPSALYIPLGAAPFPMSAIAARPVDGLKILDCRCTTTLKLSAMASIFLIHCRAAVVRGCSVTVPAGTGRCPWGGIHIGADCEDVTIEDNYVERGLGPGITLGTLAASVLSFVDHRSYFDPTGRLVLVDDGSTAGSNAALPEGVVPPGGGTAVGYAPVRPIADVRILNNTIRFMRGSGISVVGFRKQPVTVGAAYSMIQTHQFVIAGNKIEFNFDRAAPSDPGADWAELVAFGGVVLADADDVQVRGNSIYRNGYTNTYLKPTCGIYVLNGENAVVEDNELRENGQRMTGSHAAGPRAGIALQQVGRRATFIPRGTNSAEPDTLRPAARVCGNVVHHGLGRALQVYGLGPMFIQGNVLISEGLAGAYVAGENTCSCVEIQNVGQSTDLIDFGAIPAFMGFMPSPPLLTVPSGSLDLDPMFVDGRILFTGNQVRFRAAADATMHDYLVRIESYGDIAVLDNQFFAQLPTIGSNITCDTYVAGWSVRVCNNRWEDPAQTPAGVIDYQTEVSAETIGVFNITALNQASRCIEATGTLSGIADNQMLTPCAGGGEMMLLMSPP